MPTIFSTAWITKWPFGTMKQDTRDGILRPTMKVANFQKLPLVPISILALVSLIRTRLLV